MSNGTRGRLSEDVNSYINARALRGIAKTAAPSLAISILLFVSAGRLDWTMAWLGPVAIALVAGFDLRYGWQPEVSPLVQGAGALAVVFGYAVVLWPWQRIGSSRESCAFRKSGVTPSWAMGLMLWCDIQGTWE